jgi:NAD-dependent dihydropyrimidine dehydrogenase PreA subunit
MQSASVQPQPAKSSLLKILPEQSALRERTPFLEINEWPRDPEGDQPRALRGLARIIDGGLCHRCGSCVGICPTGVLGLDNQAYPQVVSLSACTDCDLCVKVCPGDEFNFHQHHQQMYGKPGGEEETHGEFIEAMVAHTNDPVLR